MTGADEVPPGELAVARAIARRLGRAVFAVRDAPGEKRRLVDERPDDPATLAYLVDRSGGIRLGPAGRWSAPTNGASLIHDARDIPDEELTAALDHALVMGRTVFVATSTEDADDDEAVAFHFVPPVDGTLRYAVRPSGDVVTGAAATQEPEAGADAGWTSRVGAAVRQIRRLRERAAELAMMPRVTPRDWARIERLVPDRERRSLHPAALVGLPGDVVADALFRAADREVERLRASWIGEGRG